MVIDGFDVASLMALTVSYMVELGDGPIRRNPL